MKSYVIVFALLMSNMILPVHAQTSSLPNAQKLIVVEDKGGVSAMPYYEAIGLTPEPNSVSSPRKMPSAQPVSIESMLPVRSENLSPGSVAARAIQAPGLRPIFIIGYDALSKQWLQQRGEVLIRLNAVGLVVNVDTIHELQQLQQLIPGLMLTPVSGDDIAKRLNFSHYPVLITPTGIEQ
ncbi:MAG: integrating conjugative element protein [Shewanella sp.]